MLKELVNLIIFEYFELFIGITPFLHISSLMSSVIALRENIKSLHDSIPRLMSDWRVKEAHDAAVTKLELMSRISEHVTSILPSAMMEVVEMSRLAEARGVKVPDQSHLVTEAQELARQLGDSFVCVTNEKLKQIDATCEMLRKKKRKG